MKELISMILTGSIACMFAVAPAFAANNDRVSIRGRLTSRTGLTREFRVDS